MFRKLSLSLFILTSSLSYSQDQNIEFKDGTKLKFGIIEENPTVKLKYFLHANVGVLIQSPKSDNILFSGMLRGGYQVSDRFSLEGYYQQSFVNKLFRNFQVGGFYNLWSHMGSPKVNISVKTKDLGHAEKTYYVKKKMAAQYRWDLYLGYSSRAIAVEKFMGRGFLNQQIRDGLVYRSIYDDQLTVNSIDLGIAFSRNLNFIYKVESQEVNYNKNLKFNLMVHLPFQKRFRGTIEYSDTTQANTGKMTKSYENLDLIEDFLNPIGFSLDISFLSANGPEQSHWVRPLGFTVGYYPLMENQNVFFGIRTGFGYTKRGKKPNQKSRLL